MVEECRVRDRSGNPLPMPRGKDWSG